MKSSRRYALACVLVCALLGAGCVEPAASQSKPEGEMRWALYVTLPPLWFDPGEVVGVITPFWVLNALHDRSEEHTSELQSRLHLVCRLLLEKKKKMYRTDLCRLTA